VPFLPVIGVKTVQTPLGPQGIYLEGQFPSGLIVHTPKSKVYLTSPKIYFIIADAVLDIPAIAPVAGLPTKKGYQPQPQTFLVTPDPVPDVPAIFPLQGKLYKVYQPSSQVLFTQENLGGFQDTPALFTKIPEIKKAYQPVPEVFFITPDVEVPAISPLVVSQIKPFLVSPKTILVIPDIFEQPAIFPLQSVPGYKFYQPKPNTFVIVPDPLPPQFPAITPLRNVTYKAWQLPSQLILITFPDPAPPVEPPGPRVVTYYHRGYLVRVVLDQ
jgi:hypothetical protein